MAAFGRLSLRRNLSRLRRVPAAARRLCGCAARCGAAPNEVDGVVLASTLPVAHAFASALPRVDSTTNPA